jgi:hypothetical protein
MQFTVIYRITIRAPLIPLSLSPFFFLFLFLSFFVRFVSFKVWKLMLHQHPPSLSAEARAVRDVEIEKSFRALLQECTNTLRTETVDHEKSFAAQVATKKKKEKKTSNESSRALPPRPGSPNPTRRFPFRDTFLFSIFFTFLYSP